jgi:hypothetical protein
MTIEHDDDLTIPEFLARKREAQATGPKYPPATPPYNPQYPFDDPGKDLEPGDEPEEDEDNGDEDE